MNCKNGYYILILFILMEVYSSINVSQAETNKNTFE